MMTIRPPQQGHGGRRSGGDAASSTSTWCGRSEQLPGTRDIGFAAGAGEEAVVTDAVEALRQNVEQEAADEFVRR